MSYRTISILFLLFGFFSCIEIEEPSDIPFIDYLHHEATYCEDQLGNQNKCITLYFKMKDGDGNIGLSDGDTVQPFTGIYRHNFYYDILVPGGDEFVSWNDLAINYFNIPYVEPEGQNKILIADVAIDFSFPISTLTHDTLIISFFIYDRELNQSNTEISDTIFFNPQ